MSRHDGKVEKVEWRNLWILRHQRDDRWKFWRIIFNSPTAEL